MNPIKLWWQQEKFMHTFSKALKKHNKCRRCKQPVNKCTYCPYRKEIKDERTRIPIEKL